MEHFSIDFLFIEEILLDIIDENISLHKCEECKKSFSNRSNFKKHTNKVHGLRFFTEKHYFYPESGDKSFVCPNQSWGPSLYCRIRLVVHTIPQNLPLCVPAGR